MNRHSVRLLAGALALASIASASAERIDIVSEGATNKIWAPPAQPLAPAYPAIVKDNDQVCVGVGYMIEKDGSTSGFMILRSWSRAHGSGDDANPAIEPFARNALAAVQQWKFSPLQAGKERKVYTATTFAFDREATGDAAELKHKCVVGNLSAFIDKAKGDAFRTGNLNKAEQESQRQKNIDLYRPRSGSVNIPSSGSVH
jgi:hypothetical protein